VAKVASKRAAPDRSSKKELLRKTILEAASRLFAERGFGGTNLQDIADALGISRPALYYYFNSKEAILASLVEEVSVFSGHQAMQLAGQVDFNPGETLRAMVRGHAKWLLEHPIEFRVVDRTESDLPLSVRKTHERAKRSLLNNFTATIERGIELGHFRPIDSEIAAFSMIGMCSWTAWWFKSTGRMSVDGIADIIADLAVSSVKRSDSSRPKELAVADTIGMLRDDLSYLERLVAGKSSGPKPGG
jgi:AcrR family transcriptional regulator